ncbi:alpha/beta hydrolase, partial [Francisella sp. 19X1-34]|uniref:alpha/beta fold hydrolase n=1 Tax=Francisella sp. 19X1-34 TaxID=3087177 RepID=UPI002E2F3F17
FWVSFVSHFSLLFLTSKVSQIDGIDHRPIIFLPGTLCDQRLFKHQLEYFSKYRDVYVANFNSCKTIKEMAEEVLKLTDRCFDLVGLSMGGIVAFEVIRQNSNLVKSLVLLDTNYAGETDVNRHNRQKQLSQAQHDEGFNYLKLIEDLYPKYVAKKNIENKQLYLDVINMARDGTLKAFMNQWNALMTRPDSLRTLTEIRCPTLIICGEEDMLIPVEKHKFMNEQIKDSDLVILKECGHLSTLESPLEVNQTIQKWYRQREI